MHVDWVTDELWSGTVEERAECDSVAKPEMEPCMKHEHNLIF